MDWIQIHLALNHIPVVGIPLFVLVLMAAWLRKRNEVIRFGLWSLAVLAAAAMAIKFTGDFAAEQSAPSFAAVKEFVSRHEEAGDQATAGVFLLGLSAALALFLARRGRPIPAWTLALVVLLGLIACLLYARSAHTGGQISHPELRSLK
jgi:hypothetical protein